MYAIIDSNRKVIAERNWNTFEACAKVCYEINKRSIARECQPCLVPVGVDCVEGLQLGLKETPPVTTVDELVTATVDETANATDGPSFRELGF